MIMAQRKREKTRPDIEIEMPDGSSLVVEVKRANVSVDDVMRQAITYVHGASATAVGVASVFGWYVRSDAPWSEQGHGDDAAICADWRAVGDDLWRAAVAVAHVKPENEQPRLFDPSDYANVKP